MSPPSALLELPPVPAVRPPALSHSVAALAAELRGALSPESVLRESEPLGPKTTLRVGGPADLYIEPASEEDLSVVRRECHARGVPFFILGRGSNLLVRDGGIRGVVVRLSHRAFSRLEIAGTQVFAGAGVKLKDLANEARRRGLAGFEFMQGIPGSVGGALRMNAGAHGGWTFDAVRRVRVMDERGRIAELPAADVPAHYRGCPLLRHNLALAAIFEGQPDDEAAIRARMDAANARRWASQPPQPSAGCIFKNPDVAPAGRLVDEAGLKGLRVGGAMVSDVHGNFIINTGGATARDVLELIACVRERVRNFHGVELATEVEIVGEDLPA
ncbi:MAG: UDP-N-acetylmuramate dehydrogenase [Verrucomicrobia bacterium]|nr:UDP-N-acetylmuramate dehydrogenase [Verrucomicrobiota bacterium]